MGLLIFSNQDVDILREELSFLLNNFFSQKSDCLTIRFIGWLSTLSFEVFDALPTALEKPRDRFIRTRGRTHNRNRSPRFVASGPHNKVGEGSRQNRSVISGKGLALRIGFRGPCRKI